MFKLIFRAWPSSLTVCFVLTGLVSGQAQLTGTVTTQHSFSSLDALGINNDGAEPTSALIVAADGSFYGTTPGGGAGGRGTVFHFVPGQGLTTVYSFSSEAASSTNSDGAVPEAGVIQGRDGNLYGTTNVGGTNGVGTLFKLTPGGTFTKLHDFDRPNGANPFAGLVEGKDGNFYGTTYQGGSRDTGTAFSITPDGVYKVLREFGYYDDGGAEPMASLIEGKDGKFYGTAYAGGAHGGGTVFSIGSDGAFTVLSSFSGFATGPKTPLLQGMDGNLYGVSDGAIYSVDPAGTVTTLLSHDAAGNTAYLDTIIQGKDGSFYGTLYGGGSNQNGLLVQRTPDGKIYPLYNFSATTPTPNNPALEVNGDGQYPQSALVQGRDGFFYGVTSDGGGYGRGTLYQLAVSGTAPLPNISFKLTGTPGNAAQAVRGGAALKIKVLRTGTDLSQPLTVAYRIRGSAQANVDYSALSGTATIPAGSNKAKIVVQALESKTMAGDDLLKLKLIPGGPYLIGATATANVQLVDAPGQ